jgi:hypothetical protein
MQPAAKTAAIRAKLGFIERISRGTASLFEIRMLRMAAKRQDSYTLNDGNQRRHRGESPLN